MCVIKLLQNMMRFVAQCYLIVYIWVLRIYEGVILPNIFFLLNNMQKIPKTSKKRYEAKGMMGHNYTKVLDRIVLLAG